MSYYNKKPYSKKYYNNYNNRYNKNYNRKEYKKYPKRKSRSRSNDHSPKNKKYSRKIRNMFNMYNKNEHLSSSSHSSISSSNDDNSIDREKTCPFLLRIFYKVNGHNSMDNFCEGKFPPELDIYTWEDADLKELTKFIHAALKDTVLGMYDYYKFVRIYYDSTGTLLRDEIGAVAIKDKNSKLNYNEKITLKEIGFQIGDYFDINITSVNNININIKNS